MDLTGSGKHTKLGFCEHCNESCRILKAFLDQPPNF
jgi:hypothetical protein